jgi:hypothetical protein
MLGMTILVEPGRWIYRVVHESISRAADFDSAGQEERDM